MLAEITAASGNTVLVERIEAAYPTARALAYRDLGQPAQAWAEAARIADPFERAAARRASPLRPRIRPWPARWRSPSCVTGRLREIATRAKSPEAARNIRSPYYRVGALTGLGASTRRQQAQRGDLEEDLPAGRSRQSPGP